MRWTVTRYCATRSWEEGAHRARKRMALVGVNAARRYERSMLYHTKGAPRRGEHGSRAGRNPPAVHSPRGIPLPGWKAQHRLRRRYVGDRPQRGRGRGRPSIATVEEAPLTIAKKLADRNWSGAMKRYAPNAARLRQPACLALATAAAQNG